MCLKKYNQQYNHSDFYSIFIASLQYIIVKFKERIIYNIKIE